MVPPAVSLAPIEVLERAARGEHVDAASVGGLVTAWIDGVASDAQMAAWCGMVCAGGLEGPATIEVARALLASGQRLELSSLGPVGSVRGTGAVGDSVPLVAAPLAAALGVRVAAAAEPGVGHIGGTLDKLAAIPGFTADLPLDRFVRLVRDNGIAMSGSTTSLAPADARLSALRDQTGTLRGGALVAASIMSRALASGGEAIVADLRVGEGAPLGDEPEARAAARDMEAIAEAWGRRLRWRISPADAPLGRFVGNALEVAEAGQVLRGVGPGDVRELSIALAGELAELAETVPEGEGPARAEAALEDGSALSAAERWVEAQDGLASVWTDPRSLPAAPEQRPVDAPRGGTITAIPARAVGEAARWLGAGRLHAQQTVDPVTGVELLAAPGDRWEAGEPFAVVHARDPGLAARAAEMLEEAVVIADAPPGGSAAGADGADA